MLPYIKSFLLTIAILGGIIGGTIGLAWIMTTYPVLTIIALGIVLVGLMTMGLADRFK